MRACARSLANMGLAGTLPASLTQLTRLQNLCAPVAPLSRWPEMDTKPITGREVAQPSREGAVLGVRAVGGGA